MTSKAQQLSRENSFERVSRVIRWTTAGVVLATFPLDNPQAIYAYIITGILIVYNITRYIPAIYRLPIIQSPVISLAIDMVYAGALIAIVGNISTPYSALLVLTVITAAYLYQMPGTLVAVLLESAMLFVIMGHPHPVTVSLDAPRLIILTVYALLVFGYLVSRLTRTDLLESEILLKQQMRIKDEKLVLAKLIDSFAGAIFITDVSGTILINNRAATTLLEHDTELIGQKFDKVVRLHRQNDPEAKPVNIFDDSNNVGHRRDLVMSKNNGETVELDIDITPIYIGDSSKQYAILCEDISQERTLEQQRTGFISVASHELRTPIAVIEAAIETVININNGLPEQTKLLLEQAHRNALQLSAILNDLAVLAEAQNDNIPVYMTEVAPSVIIDDVVADFQQLATEKGIELKKLVEPSTPSILSTERHIREILQNYLTNALKYSQQGTVTIAVEPTKNGGALFSVKDEGAGISQHDQKLLFTKFFRGENYLTETTGGTGLGLYLSMELAQRIGAKLWCESELDKGSTFFLEVPQQTDLKRDQGEVLKARVSNLVEGL